MSQHDFDFSFDLTGVNRAGLLEEAAARLDRLYATDLGEADASGAPARSAQGDFTRQLFAEEAKLPAFPVVYKITDKDFLAKNLTAPLRFTQLSRDYNFYWIYFPVGLAPNHNWNFERIEVRIEFNPGDENPHLRPKAYQILPNKEFQTLVQAHQYLNIQFNENFELAAKTGVVGGSIGTAEGRLDAGVGGVAKGGFGAVLGPFEYRIKRAKLDHNAVGMEWVFWRMDGVEFTQEDSPELVVVTQVPKGTKEVFIDGRLQAYHRFNFAAAGFQSAVANLPKVLREYFKGGAPLQDIKSWKIAATKSYKIKE